MQLLKKNLPLKIFIFSQLMILIIGLILLGGLYFFLNGQGQTKSKTLSPGGPPITQKRASVILEMTEPNEDSLVFQPEITISGKTLPNLAVLISNQSNDLVVFSKSDGYFSADFTLTEGVNNIRVMVFKEDGEQRSQDRTVYFSKEKI